MFANDVRLKNILDVLLANGTYDYVVFITSVIIESAYFISYTIIAASFFNFSNVYITFSSSNIDPLLLFNESNN